MSLSHFWRQDIEVYFDSTDECLISIGREEYSKNWTAYV